MAEVAEPKPICFGLVPPVLSVGALAPLRVWLRVSLKVTRLDLKPVVFTLEILLPTTSIRVWWFFSPDTPE